MRPFMAAPLLLVVAVSTAADTPVAEPVIQPTFSGRPLFVAPTPGVMQLQDLPDELHEFYFTRAMYSGTGRGRGWGGSWAVDYPKADQQFLVGLDRQTIIDSWEWDNAVRLDDPNLRRFPFIYALEVGYMRMTEPEVVGLRDYLMSGGFLMVDDFWGTYEWENFEMEIRRVLPEFPIVDLPADHRIFNTFYNIDSIVQVPNIRNGIYSVYGAPTYERDGYVPRVRAIFDDTGRMLVGINWNTDLGDAWEHADDPRYPLKFSTYAWAVGINFIIYAMTH